MLDLNPLLILRIFICQLQEKTVLHQKQYKAAERILRFQMFPLQMRTMQKKERTIWKEEFSTVLESNQKSRTNF